jgi:hydroxyacylglutathione hydrolase
MLSVQSFCFNPFQENTYIVYNETGDCLIIDPGMYNSGEEQELSGFISQNNLNPVSLINTHCHIDHILGNLYCVEKYGLKLSCHKNEKPVLNAGTATALMYGLKYKESPEPAVWLEEKQVIKLGKDTLEILFTPGHSPGSLSFYSQGNDFVIVGDALFYQSIGRTDLPGGHHQTLINAIKSELLTLPESTRVFSGHGPATSIGDEKKYNPFLV